MTLKDKKVDVFSEKFGKDVDIGKFDVNKKWIYEEDVKEAIKELKKYIHDFNETILGDEGREKLIDEIFGDFEE